MTSCIECQLDMHAPRAQVPLCTIATIPRQPQHCIEWAHQIAWNDERKGSPPAKTLTLALNQIHPSPNFRSSKHRATNQPDSFADDTLDTDDPSHITWLYERAAARAAEFRIPGVTYAMTQGVVKNIIPAIASTNAIVAAACTNEAFKLLTSCAPSLGYPGTNNYMMYTGDDAVYTYTFEHQRNADCAVCREPEGLEVDEAWTLEGLLERFRAGVGGGEGGVGDAAQGGRTFKSPSLMSGGRSLWYSQPEGLREATRPNLKRKLGELLADGEELAVSDPGYQTQFKFKLSFREGV